MDNSRTVLSMEDINKTRTVLYLLVALLVCAWLFPPWKHVITHKRESREGSLDFTGERASIPPAYELRTTEREWGFRLRFNPPDDSTAGHPLDYGEVLSEWKINQSELLLEMFGIVAAGGLVVVAFRMR
jgi:hypothetical protein